MSIGGSKDFPVFLNFFLRFPANLSSCSKWRNNDKRDGYLNWAQRTIIPESLVTKDRRSLIHD